METDAGVSATFAAPFESSIPLASNFSLSGVATAGGLTSIVKPPAPGRTLIVSLIEAVESTFICGTAGVAGHSPMPQKHPAQIGKSGSPPSNSTHTFAPTGGIANRPTPEPAYGTHGVAQLNCPSPSTAGHFTCTRPCIIGSTLLAIVPRYLPKKLTPAPPESWSRDPRGR